MPKNDLFSFSILIGGEPVKEYEKDGQSYIMTNLMHETTYYEERVEYVDDREERQNIPVTPYKISISLTSSTLPNAWARVYVDGYFVTRVFLHQGRERVVEGFRDDDATREFLFSLPRFGRDKDDRIQDERVNKVGCIEVHLCEAVFGGYTVRRCKRLQSGQSLDFTQATKKDASAVTKGKYTMATTKAGRNISKPAPKVRNCYNNKTVASWQRGNELSQLSVKYHMRHTLVGMGIEIA